MAHYIDKDALVAMIKSRMATNMHENPLTASAYVEDEDILEAINTLKVKEVDLEKEIDLVEDKYHSFESLSRADIIDIIKHFFELGMSVSNKAQKGE